MQNDTPVVRRSFIRSVCANVEGTLNYLMGIMAENAGALNDIEKLAFSEKQIYVKENGDVVAKPLFIDTKTKIKMVFKVLAKYPGGSIMDLSDNNFDKLTKTFRVRDRIMHPRNDPDLNVSEEEVQTAIDGYRWYIKGYQNELKTIRKK